MQKILYDIIYYNSHTHTHTHTYIYIIYIYIYGAYHMKGVIYYKSEMSKYGLYNYT